MKEAGLIYFSFVLTKQNNRVYLLPSSERTTDQAEPGNKRRAVMNIKELAQLMGQSETDVIAFVECLKVWVNKGFTVEQAIEKHMLQMTRLANKSTQLPVSIVVDAFYE